MDLQKKKEIIKYDIENNAGNGLRFFCSYDGNRK